MTKQRVIYILALILALLVLIWDRASSENETAIHSLESPSLSGDQNLREARVAYSPRNEGDKVIYSIPENLRLESFQSSERDRPKPFFQKIFPIFSWPIYGTLSKGRVGGAKALPRDPFVPGDLFLRPKVRQEQVRQNTALEALKSICLSGTMVQANGGWAMVNGQVLRVGDKLGSIRIVSIQSDNISVMLDDRIVRIMLDKPMKSAMHESPEAVLK